MANDVLMSRANSTALRGRDPVADVRGYLDGMKSEVLAALPRTAHLTPERLARIAITTLRTTPKLLECSTPSLIGALVQAAQLGLEPDPRLGLAYLVPYGKDCQLIVGYRGLMQLARRSGDVSTIEAHAVHEFDRFDVRWGTDAMLTHTPLFSADRGAMVAVYAIAKMADGSMLWDVMSRAEVDAIRGRSKTGSSGPWKTDYVEMARKTVVRRLSKYLPLSTEWMDAETVDGAVVTGFSKEGPTIEMPALEYQLASIDEPAEDLPEPSFGGEP